MVADGKNNWLTDGGSRRGGADTAEETPNPKIVAAYGLDLDIQQVRIIIKLREGAKKLGVHFSTLASVPIARTLNAVLTLRDALPPTSDLRFPFLSDLPTS